MSIRTFFAKAAGKTSQWFLQTFFKGGSSLPGKIALAIDNKILQKLAQNVETIVVTGTNGKTLTSNLMVNILQKKFVNVLSNRSGSNMMQGIVTTFLGGRFKKNEKIFAILEVDEATLPKVVEFIKPKAFVLTNIFRDQMDRYGEIYTTYQLILDGISKSPAAVVFCNGDSPIFNSATMSNLRKFYGFDHLPDVEQLAHYNTEGVMCPNCQNILHYKMLTFANLGKYYCPNCHFSRPQLDYVLTKLNYIDNTKSHFVVDGIEIKLPIGGLYNVYNALAAISVGEFYEVANEDIKAALAYEEKVFGRQEMVDVDGKKVTIILVKNPVGVNQAIELVSLAREPFTLGVLLNANYADGIDTSWIWDGNYEKLALLGIPKLIVGGTRFEDLKRRMLVAGISSTKTVVVKDDFQNLLKELKSSPTENIYVLATYTAMLNFRKNLANAGFCEGGF